MKRNQTDSSMYSGTPCNKCGGPTLLLNGGSIWCPDEDAHKGGHFVTRVAFERSPATASSRESKREWSKQPAARSAQVIRDYDARNRRASQPSGPITKVEAEPTFDTGFDGFVKSDRS